MNKGKSKKHLKFENGKEFDKTVIIHKRIPSIETTLDKTELYWQWGKPKPVAPATNWVKKIRQTYYDNKKPKSKVIVGVHAEFDPNSNDYLLQICIGDHCLFHFTSEVLRGCYYSDHTLPKDLVNLLLDDKTVVASVKVRDLEEMLEKTFGLRLSRTIELNTEAAVSLGFGRDRFRRCSLVKLAKMVLRDESGDLDWDEVLNDCRGGEERSTFRWWQDADEEEEEEDDEQPAADGEQKEKLTDVKLRSGTFHAFLAYRMGVKFQAHK